MASLHLSRSEFQEFLEALRASLAPWRARTPRADRRRLLFAEIVLPDLPDPPLEEA